MSSSRKNSDDKAVVDPMGLDLVSQSRSSRAMVRSDEARGALAKRPRDPDAIAVQSHGTRELAVKRDPVEVLRMWPHSTGTHEDHAAAPAIAPQGKQREEGQIGLAHLAIDLYREIDDLQVTAGGAQPVPPGAAAACNHQGCEAQLNALRGALVEACLLVQRVVMMTPAAKGEIAGRVRELLKLIGP